jgi:hypothetical protein
MNSSFLRRLFHFQIPCIATASLIMIAWIIPAFCGSNHDTSEKLNPARVVPVKEEPHHHLLLENEYTRVFHVEVAPEESTMMFQQDRDFVYVATGWVQVGMQQLGKSPIEKELFYAEFIKGALVHKLIGASNLLTIEVKKPSMKNVCGAFWPGQIPAACNAEAGSATNGGRSWSHIHKFETDSISVDIRTDTSIYNVSMANPGLLVALTPITAKQYHDEKSKEAMASPETKMEPLNALWIPANTNVNLIPQQAQEIKFVLVEFK